MAPEKTPKAQIPDEIDRGFASGIEDEEEVGGAWSEADAAEVRGLIREFVRLQPPADAFAVRISLPDLMDEMWSAKGPSEKDALTKEFFALHRALKAGGKAKTDRLTPAEAKRLMAEALKRHRGIYGGG